MPGPDARAGGGPAPWPGTKSAPHPDGAGTALGRLRLGWGRVVRVGSAPRTRPNCPSRISVPCSAPPPPIDSSFQLTFPFSYFCILGSRGQVLHRPPRAPCTPKREGPAPRWGLDQLILQTSRAGLPEGGGASPAWPGRRREPPPVPQPGAQPRLDISPSWCAGLDARRCPAARRVPARRCTRPSGDLGGPSTSPPQFPHQRSGCGAREESSSGRPRPRPRGQPIGPRSPGGVSRPGPRLGGPGAVRRSGAGRDRGRSGGAEAGLPGRPPARASRAAP